MDHKLSVLVQVDLDGRYVRLLVTGCLTEANQHALHPLIRRARTLIPPVTVSVDLTAAEHVEGNAVGQLRTAVHDDPTLEGTSPVELLLSGVLPEHPDAPTRMTHHLRAPGWLAA
ncbi:hypothetical protein GMA12_05000 [Kocuria sediminis]|uniref:STAS domain-containing protein n=1 Tax=Kocuria sediminis TaxID=1038857 RepID=A0A6N8GJR4_9MICC|nr:hypothetical protein [Kocuria sediminis]MUN62500.1 hypothetical protein [Kocuria sediminis]